MNANNAGCFRRYCLRDSFRIQVVGLRINVTKNRRDVLPLQRVSSGDERKGRDNNLTGESKCAYDNF